MIKRIHINQHVIRKNNKEGTKHECITVKTSKTNDYCHEVEIDGPCKVIYSPDKPLPCGAKVWIEVPTDVPVRTYVTSRGDTPSDIDERILDYLWKVLNADGNPYDSRVLMKEFNLTPTEARRAIRHFHEVGELTVEDRILTKEIN